MKARLSFKEPPILLGETRVGGHLQRFYLPLATTTAHTLVISRSGGGKSHTLATLAFGLAKGAAVRRLNLLAHRNSCHNQTSQTGPVSLFSFGSSGSLLEILPDYPPLSVCVFDPHRDLVKRLLDDLTQQIAWVRTRRKQQVRPAKVQNSYNGSLKTQAPIATIPNWEEVLEKMITYIDLGDRQNVFGLNLLDTAMWESKENCASTLIEIFKRIYPDAWGSRMEDVFRHSVFALYLLNTQRLREEQFTLLDVVPFITIDLWRDTLLDHPVISEANPTIAAWWKIQFAAKMNDNFRNEVIKPVLNKLNPFVGSDILSRIFGQAQTTLDFAPLIEGGNILLIDLAASEIETENCALAGAILIGFLLKKARHIADDIEREADRPLVQLMVDEFNVILAAPYADIMGQYRKWGVRATLATQSLTLLDELDPTLRPLVMANAANLLVLQVNAEDAEYLRRELVADGTASAKSVGLAGFAGSSISPSAGGGGLGPDLYDLVNAGRGLCYLKGTFENVREPVFSVQIAPRPFGQYPGVVTSESFQGDQAGTGYAGSFTEQQTQNEIEQERQASLGAILARCRQTYTFGAAQISEKLNHKQRDYLNLYTLNGLEPATSSLLTGFISWQNELSVMLERRLKLARFELEAAKTSRGRFDRNKGKTTNQNGNNARLGSGESSPHSQANANPAVENEARQRYDDQDRAVNNPTGHNAVTSVKDGQRSHQEIARSTKSGNVGEFHSPIPPFAPGYAIRPPVRKVVSTLQKFEETRQLPDGQDYSPAAQVRIERNKKKAKQKRRSKRLAEAEAAREQGQVYARQIDPRKEVAPTAYDH